MEVMDYGISLDCQACGASANWPCLKRQQCLCVPLRVLVAEGQVFFCHSQEETTSLSPQTLLRVTWHVRLGCPL